MRQKEETESHNLGAEALQTMDLDKDSTDKKTTIQDLKKICGKVQHPTKDFNEIIPGIVLGGITTAKDVDKLRELGITHIVNAAYDKTGKGNFIYVETNEEYFEKRNFPVKYLGTRAMDTARFKINKFFPEVIEFIHDALSSDGKVYIHCYMGISRSATYVLSYLMTKRNMKALEAMQYLRSRREIFPNDGFLQQLLDYEEELIQAGQLS